jgi:hypothetical protein
LQHNPPECPLGEGWKEQFDAMAGADLTAAGVDLTVNGFELKAFELLWALPQKGQQKPHMDTPEHEDARLSWSVLLYLDDTMSTAMHRAPAKETETLWDHNTWPKLFGMRRPTNPHLKDKKMGEQKHFFSYPVRAGDRGQLFRHTVCPHGIKNPQGIRGKPRLVLFAQYSAQRQDSVLHSSHRTRPPI